MTAKAESKPSAYRAIRDIIHIEGLDSDPLALSTIMAKNRAILKAAAALQEADAKGGCEY